MAEERLIDDDKDRKYKIRKNADGEDELVLNENYKEENPEDDGGEEVAFEVPDFDSDDEEAAVMTPEQLAAREKKRVEDEAARRAKLEEAISKTKSLLAEGKHGDAVYAIRKAEDICTVSERGEISALKLRALTADFTDFSAYEEGGYAVTDLKNAGGGTEARPRADGESAGGGMEAQPRADSESADAATEVKTRADGEGGAPLPFGENLRRAKESLEKEVAGLDAENEQKKAERRTVFREKRKKSFIFFGATAGPLLVFAALAIYFSTVMYAQKDGSNITLFFVFLALAIAFFVATVITAKFLWKNANDLKRNEKNSSTKLGRTLEEKRQQLKFAESVSEILNDLSR